MATQTQITAQEYKQNDLSPEMHFDRFQFDGKRKGAHTLDGQSLGYIGKDGMHFERHEQHRCARWIPEWALSDEKLRIVITRRVKNWLCLHGHRGKPDPSDAKIFTRDELESLCVKKLAAIKNNPNYRNKRSHHLQHVEAISQHGGYLGFITKIAWLSFRARYDGTIIAEQMGISHACVKTQILRLNQVAERLGFVLHVAHHHKGIPHKHSVLIKKRATLGYVKFDKKVPLHYSEDVHKFVEKCRGLHWTWKEIAEKLRCSLPGLVTAHRIARITGHFPEKKRKRTKM